MDNSQLGDQQGIANYKQLYNECFLNVFAEDLDTLREAGASSKLILFTIEATSKAFKPSDWRTLIQA